jgi:hypothetical protein
LRIVRRPLENPRAGWALIFRPCQCVMAKRLRDVSTCRKTNVLARRTFINFIVAADVNRLKLPYSG